MPWKASRAANQRRDLPTWGHQTRPLKTSLAVAMLWGCSCCVLVSLSINMPQSWKHLSQIISRQSPQLAQCVAAVIGTRSANQSSVEGSLSPSLTPTMSPFIAVAKASTNSGGTARSQKLDLGAAQNNNSDHVDCKSGTARMRSKRMECSAVFFSKKDLTKSGPIGDPSTRMPCAAGRCWSPTLLHSLLRLSTLRILVVRHLPCSRLSSFRDVGPTPQLLLNHFLDRADHVEIIKKSEKRFSFDEAGVDCQQCRVLSQTEEQRHERITLLSALSLQGLTSFFTHVVLRPQADGR